MDLWMDIAAEIERTRGRPFEPRTPEPVGGGCINDAHRLSDGRTDYFVKLNTAARLPMFEAEAAGLALLREPGAVRVPAPVCTGASDGRAYLVLEFVPMGRPAAGGWARLGTGLASVHGRTGERFGWNRDNTIGSTPQPNSPDDDWVRFFARQRLGLQLDLAAENAHGGRWLDRGYHLVEVLDGLFTGYRPVPSLLHGDLWSGNVDFDETGAPVIFDPAVYFGDRESDLAMTELFGRLPEAFYAAYEEAWPVDSGYRSRRNLYQLYHILNHLNLFGGGYRGAAARLIDALLAEVG